MPETVCELEGGGNSRLYLLQASNEDKYVLKCYPPSEKGRRNRLEVEFNSLEFLRANNVLSVPKPIRCDHLHQTAVYSYEAGVRPQSFEETDILQCAKFFVDLQALREKDGAKALPLASEACFTVEEHLKVLADRIRSLRAEISPTHVSANRFLTQELIPYVEHLGRSIENEQLVDAVLSPSDFGWHNTLKRMDARLTFVDFEYFGWDDLTKAIADFTLHPQHRSRGVRTQVFTDWVLSHLETKPGFEERLRKVMLLCGAKWCLIILNAFRPHWKKLRPEASGSQEDRLLDAQQLLTELKRGHS